MGGQEGEREYPRLKIRRPIWWWWVGDRRASDEVSNSCISEMRQVLLNRLLQEVVRKREFIMNVMQKEALTSLTG